MDRLRDDETEWGLTRIQYAQLAKRRLREREKKRRQRAMQRTPQCTVLEVPRSLPWFETSGIRAVTIRMVHSTNHRAVNIENVPLSLPYVSIQHSGAAIRKETEA